MNARAVLFSVLTFAAVCLAAYTWLLHDRLHAWRAAQAEEHALKEQFRLQAAAVRTPEQLHREQAALKLAAERLDRALPAEASVPDFIDALHSAAARHGLQLSAFTPLPPARENSLTALPFRIETTGSYQNIRAFIGETAKLPRTTVLNRLHLHTQPHGGLSFAAVATVYTGTVADGKTQEDEP